MPKKTPDEGLIESVRQHGILQPPIVKPDPNSDGYVISMGHRRVGAAIAAGLRTITVILRDGERRKGFTSADIARGYERLTLFGLRPEDIAASIGEKPARVRAGITAAQSPAAVTALAAGIDLEQAATIAEFDDDTDLQAHLTRVATNQPQNFAREVQQRRFIRAADARKRELEHQAEREGVTLVGEFGWANNHWRGDFDSNYSGAILTDLVDTGDHTSCPGHAYILSGYSDAKTAELRPVCTDWEGNGHSKITSAGEVVEPTSAEEIAQREIQAAERRIAMEIAAQRRQLVDANTRARRAWIHGFLHSKLRPLASHIDVIAQATATLMFLGEWWPERVLGELLTDQTDIIWSETDAAEAFDDPAVPNIRTVLAAAIAVFEVNLEDHHAITYWNTLPYWGYTLTDTDIEHLKNAQLALDLVKAEAAGDDINGDPRDDEDDA